VKRRPTDWRADFPIREIVEDCSGRDRTFIIQCHEGPPGYTVRVAEEGGADFGYEFAAFSETSPYSALGRVRDKMSRGLSTRYLSAKGDGPRMLHDMVKGRIASDGEGGAVLVIDGVGLRIDDLEAWLTSHEGWEFELRITDALE
jgi:hypothetical protein